LEIYFGFATLEGAARGNSLSGLMQNMPQLQRLKCCGDRLVPESIRAMQPGLQTNRNLQFLDLSGCNIVDDGLCLIVDALAGNTTMEVLNLFDNNITNKGLVDHITRLLELTRLKTIDLQCNRYVFVDSNAMQHFADVLSQHTGLEKLVGLDKKRYPAIHNMLVRNVRIRRAQELLAPRQPRTNVPIASKSGIWCVALSKLAPRRNNSCGASAIFKILQARPAILEKQLRGPSTAAATTTAVHSVAATDTAKGQKRRRL
jgi:Leucine Rich repeat